MQLKNIQIVFLLLLFFLSGCEKNAPLEPITDKYGKIFVTANISGAEIFLDDISTNQFTPDTVQAFATGYMVKVRKEGYFSDKQRVIFSSEKIKRVNFELQKNRLHKNVLIEYFPANNSDSCVNKNYVIPELKNCYGDSLSFINYDLNGLNPDNPFFFALNHLINSRLKIYNIRKTPAIVVNGEKILSGSDISSIKEKIGTELEKPTYFDLNVTDSLLTENGIKTKVRFTVYDTDGVDFNSLLLHIIVFEKVEICKTDGSKEFCNIVRDMLPDENGRELAAISRKGVYIYYEYKLLNPNWKKQNIFVVAFIQNKLTNQIWKVAESEQIFWF